MFRSSCFDVGRTATSVTVYPSKEAVPMDITTVNDRHLYQARVVVRDPGSSRR